MFERQPADAHRIVRRIFSGMVALGAVAIVGGGVDMLLEHADGNESYISETARSRTNQDTGTLDPGVAFLLAGGLLTFSGTVLHCSLRSQNELRAYRAPRRLAQLNEEFALMQTADYPDVPNDIPND